jgi:hypothetical protein
MHTYFNILIVFITSYTCKNHCVDYSVNQYYWLLQYRRNIWQTISSVAYKKKKHWDHQLLKVACIEIVLHKTRASFWHLLNNEWFLRLPLHLVSFINCKCWPVLHAIYSWWSGKVVLKYNLHLKLHEGWHRCSTGSFFQWCKDIQSVPWCHGHTSGACSTGHLEQKMSKKL